MFSIVWWSFSSFSSFQSQLEIKPNPSSSFRLNHFDLHVFMTHVWLFNRHSRLFHVRVNYTRCHLPSDPLRRLKDLAAPLLLRTINTSVTRREQIPQNKFGAIRVLALFLLLFSYNQGRESALGSEQRRATRHVPLPPLTAVGGNFGNFQPGKAKFNLVAEVKSWNFDSQIKACVRTCCLFGEEATNRHRGHFSLWYTEGELWRSLGIGRFRRRGVIEIAPLKEMDQRREGGGGGGVGVNRNGWVLECNEREKWKQVEK